MHWPKFETGEAPLEHLAKISRFYGSDPAFVLAGGGNTSYKQGDRLWVKGSGSPLSSISVEGFVEMDRNKLDELMRQTFPADRMQREEQYKKHVMACRAAPEKAQRPSVEATLHHLMPRKFVVHTHPAMVNMLTCCVKGEGICRELFGDAIVWVGNVDPGFPLAKELEKQLAAYKARSGRDCPRAVLMQNHGLVVCGDTPDQVKADADWVMASLGKHLGDLNLDAAFGPVTRLDAAEAHRQINTIGPALRGLCAQGENLKIAVFDDSEAAVAIACGAEGKSVAAGGPLSPDQIVYCKSFPLWFETKVGESPADLVKRLRECVQSHEKTTKAMPSVVLVQGIGVFGIGDDSGAACTARALYLDAVQVMAGAHKHGGIRYLQPDFREFIENWEVESYRKKISLASRAAGRVSGKIVIVTGAAQGFGLEISQEFAAQGGYVVLTDMNADGAKAAAAELCVKHGDGRAIGLAVNVTDAVSIEEMIHQVVRAYGGFDVLISNAGVLKAGSVKTQSEKDFDFVTSVNYKGFFLCTQKASHVLGVQRLAKSDYWSDIIQINSKSGLRGSNKNGAYAGGKFGSIGLVESFALELVEDGIKVNAICPGNFYNGPLWSDPENGLFVQYLNTGKVPGAKTIADVRRYYESQAPIRRGCTTADVTKAVYYLIDQKYETGQALPVTGGQVMLK